MSKFLFSHVTTVVVLAAFSLVVLFSSINLHGFSDAMWSRFLPQESGLASNILRGSPRSIRSDDWAVNLPLMKSQLVHSPKFPVINTLIGDGQNMLVISNVPATHWATFFRPASWGWFVNEDFGIAWFWWMRIFIVFGGFFLLFKELSKSLLIGTFVGTFVVFSPFAIYWSFLSMEIAGFGAMAVFCSIKILKQVHWPRILAWSSLLAYVATAAVYQLYPAVLIPVVWAGVFILASWCASHRHELMSMPLRVNIKRITAIVFSSLTVILFALALFDALGEAYTQIKGTEYPGSRSETGGNGRFLLMLLNLLSLGKIADINRFFGNICETAGYLFLFPFSLIIGATYFARFRKIPLDFLVLIFGNLFFFLWFFVGFPEFIAKATGFSKVLPARSLIGLLMLDVTLIVCAARLAKSLWNKDKAAVIVSYAIWMAFLVSVFVYLENTNLVTHYYYGLYQPMIVILVISSVYFWKPSLSFLGFALLAIYNTASFNPIQIGSTKLATSSFGRALLEAVAITDFNRKSHSILVSGDMVGNVPRMLGLKSIGGTMFYPQPNWLLKLGLDPKDPVVNRYANIFVEVTAAVTSQLTASSPQPDVVILTVNPNSDLLEKIDVNVIGVRENERPYISADKFKPVSKGGGYYFYVRK